MNSRDEMVEYAEELFATYWGHAYQAMYDLCFAFKDELKQRYKDYEFKNWDTWRDWPFNALLYHILTRTHDGESFPYIYLDLDNIEVYKLWEDTLEPLKFPDDENEYDDEGHLLNDYYIREHAYFKEDFTGEKFVKRMEDLLSLFMGVFFTKYTSLDECHKIEYAEWVKKKRVEDYRNLMRALSGGEDPKDDEW